MNHNNAILILSCDKYSDLWDPFFELFRKNWSDCPYQIYLGSNQIKYGRYEEVRNILTGTDVDWSTSFRKILEQIPEEYIFVWLEDIFITAKMPTGIFESVFRFMAERGANHIHFRPVPKTKNNIENNTYGVYEKQMPYKVNLVGFWKKEYLLKLLLSGENAWNFEIFGSYRASFDSGFYCLNNQLFDFINIIDKGSWIPASLKYCDVNGIKLEVGKRKQIKHATKAFFILKNSCFKIVSLVNWKFRVRLMNILRKLIISY